jgi:hypothetical protein
MFYARWAPLPTQVISALVISRSLAAKLDMTVMEPVRKLDMATAIVTDMTNRHSCSVDLKQAGRALGSVSLIGGEEVLSSAASFSGSAGMLRAEAIQRQLGLIAAENRSIPFLVGFGYVCQGEASENVLLELVGPT